ncbi:phosphodiesterase [Jannaschia pagri]|uniref:Phosphodiesterase n=1 Tax=Jannaschia pagri TaxID=2829797 RepID=A0ABQ4NQ85_9RHOB|nr:MULTISPECIES: glycerophosphodiester phosphodiesterase family protein [unclassified Jannaschia]GIT92566.1 phosphodiesterase [Jannaschia sp. AI_61]GIT96574.1 phosphodiesterase [Jannaschia sp. AI_62]
MTELPLSLRSGRIAHRGLHDRRAGRPENSMQAFRAAIEAGFAIELDVQPSSDGIPMAFHDYALDRLTEATGPVRDKTAAELAQIDLIGGSGGIPTLAAVLDEVAGQVPLLIEIKDQDGAMGGNVGALEDAVLAVLDGYVGDVAVMSFNPHSVAHMAKAAPQVPRGMVTSAYHAAHWPGVPEPRRQHLATIPDVDRVQAAFISHEVAALDMPRVAELKAAGLPILCWTVRSAAQEVEARRIADGVTFEGYLP